MPATRTSAHAVATRIGRETDAGATADGTTCNAETTEIRGAIRNGYPRLKCGLRGSADDKTRTTARWCLEGEGVVANSQSIPGLAPFSSPPMAMMVPPLT